MENEVEQSVWFDMTMTLGLVVAALFVLWGYVQLYPDSNLPGGHPGDEPLSLAINHEQFTPREHNTWHLTGTVANRTKQEYAGLVVQVELIDEEGEVLVSDLAVLNGDLRLRPGDRWNFKISKAILRQSEPNGSASSEGNV